MGQQAPLPPGTKRNVRVLPRMLFQEFVGTQTVTEDDRLVGETPEGATIIFRSQHGMYRNSVLQLHWHPPQETREGQQPLLEIETGLTESQTDGSVQCLQEGARVWYPIMPYDMQRDLREPRVRLIGDLIRRAAELVQSGAFDLRSYWHDWKNGALPEELIPSNA